LVRVKKISVSSTSTSHLPGMNIVLKKTKCA
jgi:hypothetical protein